MNMPIPRGRRALKNCSWAEGAFKVSWNSLDARGEAVADFWTGLSSPGQEEPEAAQSWLKPQRKTTLWWTHPACASYPAPGLLSSHRHCQSTCPVSLRNYRNVAKEEKALAAVRRAWGQFSLCPSRRERRESPPSETVSSPVMWEKAGGIHHIRISVPKSMGKNQIC